MGGCPLHGRAIKATVLQSTTRNGHFCQAPPSEENCSQLGVTPGESPSPQEVDVTGMNLGGVSEVQHRDVLVTFKTLALAGSRLDLTRKPFSCTLQKYSSSYKGQGAVKRPHPAAMPMNQDNNQPGNKV